jgi:hypothetical protein
VLPQEPPGFFRGIQNLANRQQTRTIENPARARRREQARAHVGKFAQGQIAMLCRQSGKLSSGTESGFGSFRVARWLQLPTSLFARG